MADIAACGNGTCPKRIYCYRFRCVWSNYQSFSHFRPQGDTCAHFWELSPKDHVETFERCEARVNPPEESSDE